MAPTRSMRLPPQVAQPSNTAAMMTDVLVALLPALAMAVFFFGPRVLVLCAVSVGSCVLLEYGYRRLTHQSSTVGDLSACVTGLLLALSLPSSAAYWVPVLGAAFAIVVVKQFYGGLGKNFMNPALAGRMLLAAFPMLMTSWSEPLQWGSLLGVDAVSAATPMSYLQDGTLPPQTLQQLLLGQQAGSMGEVSSLMLLAGGLYLVARHVISPRIPLAYLGTAAVISLLFHPAGINPFAWAAYQLLSGGILMGAVFFASDPVTTPVTPRGQLMFGVCCGALTMLLRFCSSYPEGVGWAILTMNCCVWLLDRAGMPRRFGTARFSVLQEWRAQARESMAEIKFIKPHLRLAWLREGKAPGEAHLDQIRAQAKVLGILGAVVLVTGAAVSCVHVWTDLDAARTANRAQQELLSQVMPQAAFSSETPYRASGALSIQAAYSADNELLGYCVEVQSQGFNGMITMMVGVNLNGEVTGVAAISHKEAPNVGTRAMTEEALSRYVGMSGTIRTSGSNSVDVVAGATVTSEAITAGVNRALAIVASLDTSEEIEYADTEV